MTFGALANLPHHDFEFEEGKKLGDCIAFDYL
jgi:hypothetical protein